MAVQVHFAQTFGRRLALGFAAIALAGCATMATTPEQAVSQRAVEYMQARKAADYDKSYSFMPPSYRAVTPLATYKRGFGAAVQLIDAQVEKVVCETADKCLATVKVEAKPLLVQGRAGGRVANIVTYYKDIWIREDNKWWLFPTP
jgi:hypothetical protein